MYQYKLIKCPYCHGILAAKTTQKTKTCPYCNRKFKISGLKVLALARNSKEASIFIRYYKAKEAGIAEKLYGNSSF